MSAASERPGPRPGEVGGQRAAQYRARGWWSEQTLADHVARHAQRRGDEPAFVTTDGRLTWAGYEASSDGLAQVLVDLGVAAGERVAVRLPDAPSYHVAQLGCEKAGAVVVGLPARAGPREVTHLVTITGAVAVISHDVHRGEPVGDWVTGLPRVRHHLVVPHFEHDPEGTVIADGSRHVPQVDREMLAERRLGPDDEWLINSTSGTTGLPKCVPHAQNRWHYFSRMAIEFGGMGDEETVMSVVPTPYGFGQWSAHFVPCYLGATTVLVDRFATSEALALLERERATVLCAVSTQFRMLLADPACQDTDLSSLRVMFTGGEPVPYEAARRFELITGAPILNVYGSNEAGFVTGTSIRDAQRRRLTTAGRVPPGTELRLYDEHGRQTTGRGPGSADRRSDGGTSTTRRPTGSCSRRTASRWRPTSWSSTTRGTSPSWDAPRISSSAAARTSAPRRSRPRCRRIRASHSPPRCRSPIRCSASGSACSSSWGIAARRWSSPS